MSVRVFAPAKVNLTLQVGAPRADGLHPLQSVVVFADLGDIVEAAPADELTLTVTGEFAADIQPDESNLVLRAARALAAAAGVKEGAALRLEKDLPIASGIGGGSSDAAATLHALCALWQIDVEAAQLHAIARTLGADVPVCVARAPAYMTGAGETWTPLKTPECPAVLINPLKPLPTPDVYRRFDAMGLGASFEEQAAPVFADRAALIAAVKEFGNDLEAAAQALMPELSALRELIASQPAVRALGLSGSGATMFALTETESDAAALAETLQRARPDCWVAETILGGA